MKNLKFQLTGKYVGEMYGDNTSRKAYKQEAYFLLNFRTSYKWHLGGSRELEAQFIVRNLLDHKYRIIAWVADWQDDDSTYYNGSAYFQQPGINFTGRMVLSF